MPSASAPGDLAAVSARHQRDLAARGVRKAMGSYYTPPDVVAEVLDLALSPALAAAVGRAEGVAGLHIVDPACGTGHFLVAAAERVAAALAATGSPEREARLAAVATVWGVDIDPGAVRRCRAALRAFAGLDGSSPGGRGIARRVVVGDALHGDPLPRRSFDVVVGNPPFLSQLGSATARTEDQRIALRARFGADVSAYTDPAAAFLLVGLDLARPDGARIALVQPRSVATARDAAGVRRRLVEAASLDALWLVGEGAFDAAVDVCVPVLRVGDGPAPAVVHLRRGRPAETGGTGRRPTPQDRSWSHLLAASAGLPRRVLRGDGVLGDLAEATADFRDQYYGLAGHMVDRPDGDDARHPPLVTSGLIDPAHLAWGERTTRFNKATYRHPRVDRAALSAELERWVARRTVPKVLVATQTRVLEAVVDPDGRLLPSVPVLTVTAEAGRLWHVAAVLTCPSVTLEAAGRHLGAARNATALKLSASDLLALPLPSDHRRWAEAAAQLRAAHEASDPVERHRLLVACGAAMDAAYGCGGDHELLSWWVDRLPSPGGEVPAGGTVRGHG